jgi:hypothetical protein
MSHIQHQLKFINDSLACIRHYRPAWRDEYMMEPPLSEAQIVSFENQHRCRLPQEYREFLMHVGDGGAGPENGLFRLGEHLPGSGHEGCMEDAVALSTPFPQSGSWNELPPADSSSFDEIYFSPRHADGSLLISDRGCALWTRLIITGPSAGQIWYDSRADHAGLYPLTRADGTRLTFLVWYLGWITPRLKRYGHDGPTTTIGA